MHIHSAELTQVAAAAAPRFDMYVGIHKAMRALMTDTLLAVGRADTSDELELAQVTQRVLELLEFCAGHLGHENQFIHPALEARAAGTSAQIAQEHVEHTAHLTHLADLVGQLRDAPTDARPTFALQLYRALALFIAENFQHMHVEETAHNAVLWARYTDAELIEIHDELVASIPPQEMMVTARWLVPFMNPVERVELLVDIRGKAPAPAFQALLDTVQPHLSTHEWAKLARALALPAAPGLAQG